jgi:hypothetical protein
MPSLKVTEWVSHPFPPNLQNIKTAKPLELGTWNFDTIFAVSYTSSVMCHVSCVTCHVSRVTCHGSHVTCHMSRVTKTKKGTNDGASWSRVCYQQDLPRLVFAYGILILDHICSQALLLPSGAPYLPSLIPLHLHLAFHQSALWYIWIPILLTICIQKQHRAVV